MKDDIRIEYYEFLERIRGVFTRCRREIIDAARDMQKENKLLLAEVGFFTLDDGGNA